MEIKKTNVHLAYRVEEKPEGGFIARSDDPNVESIEAATKAELFQKMRDKTAQLIGKEIPLDLDLKTSDFNFGGANIHVNRKINVNVIRKSTDPQRNANWTVNSDAPLAAQESTGWNLWKILFFGLLGLLIAWYFLRHY